LESGSAGFNGRMFYHTGQIPDAMKDAGAALLADTKLTAAVKKSVESRSDFPELLAKCPTASEVIKAFA
jgi:hypothetical protein